MNYYNEINRMMEQWIHGVISYDRKGFKVGTKGEALSLLELNILKKIGEGESKKLYELMEEMDIDRGFMASSAKKLILNGYIIKEKSNEDKRVTILRLTPEGREIIEKKIHAHRDYLNKVLSTITLNEEKAISKFLKIINETPYLDNLGEFPIKK